MFWTNWNDNQASIMSSYLSGWEVKKIVTQDIRTPNGLAIDHPAYKLYWSDARLDKIERCNFDGTDRKVSVFNIHFALCILIIEIEKLMIFALLGLCCDFN
jgi:sugar lactone lactonase YvrE